MRIIDYSEFEGYWNTVLRQGEDAALTEAVQRMISAVRCEGDAAVRCFAAQFDKSAPETLEVSPACVQAAYQKLERDNPELHWALSLAAAHIRRFAEQQKAQFADFEYQMADGLVTGQRVIPVRRAAIYAPAGRFPLISTVLMGVIPALIAGVEELIVASPPLENGLPDERIMAAAYLAAAGASHVRVFAIGGAQAIAALALGTETVPRVDVVAGPGNKYVATAKRLLYGETGIDFIAGPSDVLIIADAHNAHAEIIAADMLAQAEHDPDARARALVPDSAFATLLAERLEARLGGLPTAQNARAALDAGGLIITYTAREDAVDIANTIAPEHLELQVAEPEVWIPRLRNYGSLFIGSLAAEVLGDYSAGINNTLPTAGSARFTSGLSVRHFLKTPTTLRCAPGAGYNDTRRAAHIIAQAEGLAAHAESAAIR
ncbi:MAG: histidinol dehydrogenase [Treponema sp.]|jgi:histidinol dehydrogenase|nr:histidinol dehydrogenase [Treponema sp.]